VVLVVAGAHERAGGALPRPLLPADERVRREVPAEALLERYRQRGTAEKDFGEWKQALDVSLSSSPRPKATTAAARCETPYTEPDSFAANEARLLLSLIAANLMHAGAELLAREEAGRMSRERFRQLLLKVTGRAL
jgi:hypothetical protein